MGQLAATHDCMAQSSTNRVQGGTGKASSSAVQDQRSTVHGQNAEGARSDQAQSCYDYAQKSLDSVVMTMWAKSIISHGLLVVSCWLTDQSAGVALVSIVLHYHMLMDITHS
jgi:hypothetical protein